MTRSTHLTSAADTPVALSPGQRPLAGRYRFGLAMDEYSMGVAFGYDAAISFVGYDALTARRLVERLCPRLELPVFLAGERPEEALDAGELDAAARVLQSEARIVIVLHQRLWGDTPSTRIDRRALERRVARDGNGFLVLVALEPEPELPEWMARAARAERLTPGGIDAAVQAIAAAVERAGGATVRETPSESAERREREEQLEQQRAALLHSQKAATAVRREIDTVITDLARRASEVRSLLPDIDLRMRRTPDRCVLQAGDIGLSVSWLRTGARRPADGALLVIEWDGTITLPGESASPTMRATPVCEHVLHLDAGGSPEWRWCSDDSAIRAYTSRDLAGQCMHRVLQRLREPVAD